MVPTTSRFGQGDAEQPSNAECRSAVFEELFPARRPVLPACQLLLVAPAALLVPRPAGAAGVQTLAAAAAATTPAP